MWKFLIALILFLITGSVYCCLIVSGDEDRRMEKLEEEKEKTHFPLK